MKGYTLFLLSTVQSSRQFTGGTTFRFEVNNRVIVEFTET